MIPVELLSPIQLRDVSGLGLLLPIGESSHRLLVTPHREFPVGVILSDHLKFGFVDSEHAKHISGLFLGGISIEVDPSSAYGDRHSYSPYGALIRRGTSLSVFSRVPNSYGFSEGEQVELMVGLPPLAESLETGFYRWRVSLGDGDTKQTLEEIQIEPADGPPR